MKQRLALIAIVVRDYDEAISFYVNQLGFNLIEDKQVTPDKRRVVVAPPGSIETRL
jgi:catechol 2,3-dioxygenase-like lactoylglutathione lyase family enzyme